MHVGRLGPDFSAAIPLLSLAREGIAAALLVPCHVYVIYECSICEAAEVSFVKYGLPGTEALCSQSWSELWRSACLFPPVQSFLPGMRNERGLWWSVLP